MSDLERRQGIKLAGGKRCCGDGNSGNEQAIEATVKRKDSDCGTLPPEDRFSSTRHLSALWNGAVV